MNTLGAARARPARASLPGELAVVSGGHLLILGPVGARHVAGAVQPSGPAWSPDGKWVAFFSARSALWVARSDGTGAHRVSPAGAAVGQFAWAVRDGREMLAFSVYHVSSNSGTVFVSAPASKTSHALATYPNLIGFSVAPSGNELAVSYRAGKPPTGAQPPTWKGLVQVVPLAGGPARTVYTLPAGGYALLSAGWWPDGKGLLFWDDPAGSASIAADGLALESLDLATGGLSTLATTLTYPNWLAWSKDGKEIAIVAGPNRVVWDSGKHIVLCAMPTANCHSVAPPRATMSLDPVWSAQGSLVYDLAPANASGDAASPPGIKVVGDGPFDQATLAAWYAVTRLYVATPAGTGGRLLKGAAAGAHDPLATSGGLLYVRASSLWYLPTGSSQSRELVGALADPGYYGAPDYYGYSAWYEDFAWHA